MTRQSDDDDFYSLDKLNRQLLESIEQSREMTRRSQQLLDGQRRSGEPDRKDGEAA